MKTIAPYARVRRRLLVAAAALLVAGIAACEDPFKQDADSPTLDGTFEIWALNGTPPQFPSVILVPQRLVVRPDVAGSFDLGFDIDPDGRLVVLPVTRVVDALAGPRSVGLIRTDSIYNLITAAPRTGWIYDSVLTVNEGQVFLVKVQTQFCTGSFNTNIYAKYHVDSVIVAERRIKISGRVNPNCGFRSFLSGVPTF